MAATIYIETLGCDKNKVDSERLLKSAWEHGFAPTTDEKQAHVLVINTCAFLTKAVEESLEILFNAVRIKELNGCETKGNSSSTPRPIVVLTGCLVGRYGQEQLQKQLPEVDIILPQEKIHELGPRLIKVWPKANSPILNRANINYWPYSEATLIQQGYAFIKIAEGCNRACSFCVIPQIRGKQHSLPPERIEELVLQKINMGIKEINLIAQDSSNYGHDLRPSTTLAQLLQRIAPLSGLRWLRLLYLNPDWITDELIETISAYPSIVPYLDIPMQHASGKLLRLMNRPGDSSYFLELIAKLRHRLPDIIIRSSFIIGYPHETEQDFQELVSFVQKAQLDRVGFFLYSDEEGASSYEQYPKIPEEIQQERYETIFEIQRQISQKKMSRFVGQQLELLVIEKAHEKSSDAYNSEEYDKEYDKGYNEKSNEEYLARSQWDAPEVDGVVFLRSQNTLAPGDMVSAEITGHLDYDLFAEI